jgi:hypothetical protein
VLWDTTDYIIGRLGVPLGKRGGWGYQGTAPDDEEFTVTKAPIMAMSNDPFNGGNFMRGIDKNLNIWRSDGPSFAAWVIERQYSDHSLVHPANGLPKQNGVFIADGLFFPSSNGTLLGSSHNELYGQDWNMAVGGGGEVIYLATHLNRLVGLDALENLWFGNPTVDLANWDEDAKYALGQPGRGLIGLGKEMLVFFDGHVRKVKGSIPAGYGITQDDISIELFAGDIGCLDAFSIVHWNINAIWVDHSGVWMSDGATYPLDLTWAGGAKDLFLDFMRSYVDRDTTRLACGIYSDMLVVSMTDIDTDAAIDTLVCDLNKRTWSRQTNMAFTSMVRGALNTSETWAGIGNNQGARVAKISPILLPTATNTADADDTVVLPSFQTAYFRLGPEDSRIHRLFLGYEIDVTLGTAIAASLAWPDYFLTFTANDAGEDGNDIIIQVNSFAANGALWGTMTPPSEFQVFWAIYVEAGVTTLQDIADIVAAYVGAPFTATPGVGHETDTFLVDEAFALPLAGGVDAEIPVSLEVEYSGDPRADPTFTSVASLEPKDIHGEWDNGYHWKPAPVHAQFPGLAVKVTQVGPSEKTSIHSIGIESQPHPTYSQR